MSGGSFDYLYHKRDGDALDNIYNVEAMEKWCREQGYHDAADELYDYLLLLKTAQRRINKHADRLQDLMHTIEWECDSDIAKGSVIKATEKLLAQNSE